MHEAWQTGWPRPSEFYGYVPQKRRLYHHKNRLIFGVLILTPLIFIFVWGWLYLVKVPIVPPNVSALPLVSSAVEIKSVPDNSQPLQALLSSWAAAHPAQQWGIDVRQLNGGASKASHNPNQQFFPASIYKLLVMGSLLGKLPYSEWDKTIDKSGPTYAACVDRMIRHSDNPCGVAIGRFVGWKNADINLKNIGLSNTRLSGDADSLHTTAADVSLYLQEFYTDNRYPQAKQSVMTSMSRQIYKKGIQAGSPGCTVYDKIGDLDGVRHDAAIVECPDSAYILTILSRGGSYAQIADLSQRVNTVLTNTN